LPRSSQVTDFASLGSTPAATGVSIPLSLWMALPAISLNWLDSREPNATSRPSLRAPVWPRVRKSVVPKSKMGACIAGQRTLQGTKQDFVVIAQIFDHCQLARMHSGTLLEAVHPPSSCRTRWRQARGWVRRSLIHLRCNFCRLQFRGLRDKISRSAALAALSIGLAGKTLPSRVSASGQGSVRGRERTTGRFLSLRGLWRHTDSDPLSVEGAFCPRARVPRRRGRIYPLLPADH
jgi:hypothetical protein